MNDASALKTVTDFLEGWKPFADLPTNGSLRRDIVLLLETATEERRSAVLARANQLMRLHGLWRELGIFRAGPNERAEQFDRIVKLSVSDLARTLGSPQGKEDLALLQYAFEFGRHAVDSRQHGVRAFLLELFSQPEMSPPIKFSLFPGGVLYTGGGKTHDEMAKQFAEDGFGGGKPIMGGLMVRTGTLAFSYDVSSTAVRAAGQPTQVRDALLRSLRATGADPDRVAIKVEKKLG